jgi:phage terminase large subunit
VSASAVLDRPVAEVFEPLLESARYKGAHGGRGSGKSHFFGEQMLEDALAFPGSTGGEGMRGVCIREVQKDLKESSKALLESKLRAFGLGSPDGFRVFKDCIALPGDGIIIFKGMNDYTAESIKSLEGFHRAWWTEAQTATAHSLNMLRPTIRARGSELWFDWNPRFSADPVDLMLRGPVLPTGAQVVVANWRDNPFITEELLQERRDCLRDQADQYDHIWEGGYQQALVGSYFAELIAKARLEGRIGHVGPDPNLTFRVFCDLGGTGNKADNFVMWVAQFVGLQIRVLAHYEAQGQPLAVHLQWLREHGYVPANTGVWLPHDGATQERTIDASFEKGFKDAGYPVEVVPNQGKGAAKQRIEAVRRLFPSMWINEPACPDGLVALGWYHEKRERIRKVGLGPDHDWSSDSADAYGLMAICHQPQGGAGWSKDPVYPRLQPGQVGERRPGGDSRIRYPSLGRRR